jgi:hypothetical protein
LAALVPGAASAVALASVDRSALSSEELLDLAAARSRLIWHLQAELLADTARLVAVLRAEEAADPDARPSDEDEWVSYAGTVLGWQLGCAAHFAQGRVELGLRLEHRLPAVLERLRAGRIDDAKAGAFDDALACVDEETARRIAARLLDRAARWTLAELRERLRYHVRKACPDAPRREYQKGVVDRDVTLRGNHDGTANLSGLRLPPHKAAAGFDRLDRLARSARALGDPRNLAQLRCDAFADILCGIPFQIVPSVDPVTAQADAAAERASDHRGPATADRSDRGVDSRFWTGNAMNPGSGLGDADSSGRSRGAAGPLGTDSRFETGSATASRLVAGTCVMAGVDSRLWTGKGAREHGDGHDEDQHGERGDVATGGGAGAAQAAVPSISRTSGADGRRSRVARAPRRGGGRRRRAARR